jgi:hypothetical protein
LFGHRKISKDAYIVGCAIIRVTPCNVCYDEYYYGDRIEGGRVDKDAHDTFESRYSATSSGT